MNYTITLTYTVEANSKLHAEMIIKQYLKGKGVTEKTEDEFGYNKLEAVDKPIDK